MSGTVGTVRSSETEEVTDLQNRLYTLERKRSAGEKVFLKFPYVHCSNSRYDVENSGVWVFCHPNLFYNFSVFFLFSQIQLAF